MTCPRCDFHLRLGPRLWRRRMSGKLLVVAAILAAFPGTTAGEQGERPSVLFLHHSCGRNLIRYGGVRELLTSAGYDFWDHGYNQEQRALTDPRGEPAGCYWIPDNNLWADGFAALFAMHGGPQDTPFARITANHDVILFKSCYPASDILPDDIDADRADPARKSLSNYRRHYLAIRNTVDRLPGKIFTIVTQPPLHPLATSADNALRAREFVHWISSEEYLQGRQNLFVFDFFSLLADPETNRLRREYQRFQDRSDSHPNVLANVVCGPLFADFIANIIEHGRNGGPEVSVDQASGANVFVPVSVAEFALTGRARDARGLGRITWTDLRGNTGELPPAEVWRTPPLPLEFGTNRFAITAYNRDGLRRSSAVVLRRLNREPAEISLFADSLKHGVLSRCRISDEAPASGGHHLVIEGTGEWQLARIGALDIDISGLDPATAYLQFSLDRGRDTVDYVSCGLNIGSQLIHPDSEPGYETFTIPFRDFSYLDNAVTRFTIGAVWGKGSRILVDDIGIACPGPGQ